MLLNANLYSETYAKEGAAQKYDRKFNTKIQHLRHLVEVSIISPWVEGDFFDCSVGNGRFIPAFKKAVTYTAMDYSPDFINFIKSKYPHVQTKVHDLEQGINEEINKYDTVFCLRTIFALRNLRHIINEMCRITKPGGVVILDSGKRKFTNAFGGVVLNELVSNDIISILKANNMLIIREEKVDGFFPIICNNHFLTRLFNSRYNFLPQGFYLLLEKLSLPIFHNRSIIIAQKKIKG